VGEVNQMPFSFTTNKKLIARWDGSNFQEQDLTVSGLDGIVVTETAALILVSGTQVLRSGDTMTGFLILNANPTANLHAATKQYVDAAVGGSLTVREDNVVIASGIAQLNFTNGLDVVSGSGQATISIDETELTSVVFLTGAQTISGVKTFANPAVFLSDVAISGTVLTTEFLTVEDNFIILNSTVTGTAILDGGIAINRGVSLDAIIRWNETLDVFQAGISGSEETIVLQSALVAASGVLAASDLAISGVLQAGIDTKVSKAGDIMLGNLTLSGANLLTAVSGTGTIGALATPFLTGFFDRAYGATTPVSGTELTSKAYVDAQVAGAAVVVNKDGNPVVSGASVLNFTTGLIVTSGAGVATIAVDFTALNGVVYTSGNQTISGTKTFDSPIVVASGLEPATIADTGVTGELRFADDYLYLCVSGNSWKRTALAQF